MAEVGGQRKIFLLLSGLMSFKQVSPERSIFFILFGLE
jgi:hypothetical protein